MKYRRNNIILHYTKRVSQVPTGLQANHDTDFCCHGKPEKNCKAVGFGIGDFVSCFFFSSFLIQLIYFLKKAIINGCKVGVKPVLKGMDSSINACPSPISLSLGKIFIKHRQKDKRQDKIPIISDPYQH